MIRFIHNSLFLALFLFFYFLSSCAYQSEEADLIVHNAQIHTCDETNSTFEAMAIKNGKIIELGAERQILNKYSAKEKLDAARRPLYPGFIDAHSHLMGYAKGLGEVDLVGTTSWEEVLERVVQFSEENEVEWIEGRGWDQNDWEQKTFPNRSKLDSLFPDQPVVLSRIDGHAVIANGEALKRAELRPETEIIGGDLLKINGELTGVLIDNAATPVNLVIPELSESRMLQLLLQAEANCFAKGLTSVCDAGLSHQEVEFINSLHESGDLKIKVYTMYSDSEENYKAAGSKGPFQTDRLTARSFKFYADGALGSRGACLLDAYDDVDGEYKGFLLSEQQHFEEKMKWCNEEGFQVCTHAIGDSAARMVLNIYADILEGMNDKRWRMEHAQVVHPEDLHHFSENVVIPSVQPTHATSDMYWAEDRLGEERMEYAYAFKTLKEQLQFIPLGTDFPVESIDPIRTFYSAVFRKDYTGYPEGGFLPEESLTREEALYGMTIWAAIANFEEEQKGSLELGKAADFVILDRDILKVPEEQVKESKVLYTFVNGEKVFSAE